MGTVSPQRNEAPGGARDWGPSRPSQVEAWNWRSIKQFFSNWGRWNHCFWVPIITLFPEGEVPTRGPGVRGTDNTTDPWTAGLASQPRTRSVASACLHPALTHQTSLQPQTEFGGRRGHLTVDSLGVLESHATRLWQGHMLLSSEHLSAFDFEPAKSHELSSDKGLMRVQRLLPGAHSRCAWATLWTVRCIDWPLLASVWPSFSSSRRPCPVSPQQPLLAQRNALWKSSQHVASAAKTPKSRP